MLNNYDYEAIHGEDSNIALLFLDQLVFSVYGVSLIEINGSE